MRGPMLAGKALDKHTATDNYMRLAQRTDRVRMPSTKRSSLKLRV